MRLPGLLSDEALALIPTLRRRSLLAAAPALFAGCAAWRAPAPERIVDIASARDIARETLVAALRGADYALLGELHDNALHHARRGELLEALGPERFVCAEHLPAGRRVAFGADLRKSLVDAGFDERGWGWPLHEALFAAAARAGDRLEGANAPQDLVRRAAREGRTALPDPMAALVDAAPLPEAGRAALEADLLQGHCGQLDARRVPALVWAQRTRDAAMAQALRDARASAPALPVLLVAGNGHVRRDYGVPLMLAAAEPAARVVVVGFGETGEDAAGAPYDYLWLTAPAERGDPCEGMRKR